MTILLKQAFEKASQLPDDLQDQLAQEVLEDIAGELQLLATGQRKKAALTAYMHKLLTIMNAMVRDRTPWQPREVSIA